MGDIVLAEIKGKLSKTGSNLTERLEDNLTGNFFGALRYIPFNFAMKKILMNGVYPREIADEFEKINVEFWNDNIKFWPYDIEGEIDALLEFEDTVIGIEVKYLSGLSSDDDMGTSEQAAVSFETEKENSINQLARESRIVTKNGEAKSKILLFIASGAACREVYDDVTGRTPPIIEDGVLLGYLSWQTILEELKKLNHDNPYYQIITNDLISLLTKKGFESFKDMLVSMDELIDEERYFDFSTGSLLTIHFDSKITIDGGLYYEFS